MKIAKVVVVLFIIISGVLIVRKFENRIIENLVYNRSETTLPTTGPSTSPKILNAEDSTSIFVPYWAFSTLKQTSYDRLLYFGITPGEEGINTTELGYKNLKSFTNAHQNEKKYLVLRMTNSQQNFAIIENRMRSQKIITETVEVAKEYGFDGIVLNLEVSALPFDSVIKNITYFVTQFSSIARGDKLSFAMTMYGDTFYRLRPFDINTIAKNVDEVMVMAYDFSKANGNPGPNFPLGGKDKYGYDFQTMIEQFSKFVPVEKLTIIFGMYGYDWPVDENGKATGSAKSLTNHQIKQKFIDNCLLKDCKLKRDKLSSETTVSYTNDEQKKHTVWFEDLESVKMKKAFLKTRGIGSVSYWAYSYF